MNKGILLAENIKEYVSAIEVFSQVLSLNSYVMDAYHYRGFSYFYDNQFEKAKEDFSILLSQNPNNWKLLFYRSLCFKELKLKNYYMEDFIKAGELNPNLPSWIEENKRN